MTRTIDLFAGAGGFSTGFKKAGYKITKAVEFDSSIAETYKNNHPETKMIVDDIRNVDQSDEFQPGEADLIIGGPPCQGFSMAGARNRDGFIDDPRNYLFKHYFNIVKRVKPRVFIIENVKGLLSMAKGQIFKEIQNIFSDKNRLDGDSYTLYWRVAKAVEFGIPQKRERVIIVGVLNGNDINFEELWEKTKDDITHKDKSFFDRVTIADAIKNLPTPTSDGIIDEPYPETDYERYIAGKEIPQKIYNHETRVHSEKVLARLQKIEVGDNFQSLNENIKSVHSGSYGRMSWDEPAMTITTRFDTPSGGRFTLPDQNRTLTAREAARIQSFPDAYRFYGNKTSINKQIGNAVPPKLAFFLANFVDNIFLQLSE
ncbi:DNA cytosine methyltransferase [Ligilactobacillus equi]|uniref:DNA cytosine methyltransferase n=1 Tax=Ligilactobacillus equi TaxID=137357 RepID=UPI002ED30D6A